MEHLFSPCTRLFDLVLETQDNLWEPQWDDYFETIKELNLDVSTQELLSAERAFTYADLCALLGNRDAVLWLTPYAAVVRADGIADVFYHYVETGDYGFSFNADGKHIIALALSSEALSEILGVVCRLLVANANEACELDLRNVGQSGEVFFNAPSFAYLMGQCESLKTFTLNQITLDEDDIHVLGKYSRPDLEIELSDCRIKGAAAEALAEVLGRNQGPTKLDLYEINNLVLANGLRGNSRLKLFTPLFSSFPEVGNRQVLEIAGALKENKGLVDLDLSHDFRMCDETWDAICDSLKTHPTLEVLNLRPIQLQGGHLAAAVVQSRTHALVDMLKVNTLIHTIHLDPRHDIYWRSVTPYLETNRLRPRVLAIQKTRPIPYRAKVLGRALIAARTEPNSFWMLLSENAEVVFE
jgi:hypothetical protein